jgi:ATP-dependent protease ClpP protease subunit
MGEVIPKIHRPDPARTVKLSGRLTIAAAGRLGTAIGRLAQASPAPITLHIHSGGGEVDAFYQLAGVLETLRTDGKTCRVFTVASHARSAAAYLLLAGHRAFALPNAKLCLHGTRGVLPKGGKPLSREKAFAIAMRLDRENRSVARTLAKRLVFRLAARQRELRTGHAGASAKKPMADLEKLTRQLAARLTSDGARRLLHESFERLKLVFALSPQFPIQTPFRRLATREAKVFQAAIAYELAAHRGKEWRLDATAGTELLMDYLIARDFLSGDHLKLARRLARRFGPDFLPRAASAHYEKLRLQSPAQAEAFLLKAALPGALGLWYFTMTLCHRLLAGDHTFSAQDAYWLGLVDAVLTDELST